MADRLEPYLPIRLTVDGDQHCALLGPNIQEGTAGFGPTRAEALVALALDLAELDGTPIGHVLPPHPPALVGDPDLVARAMDEVPAVLEPTPLDQLRGAAEEALAGLVVEPVPVLARAFAPPGVATSPVVIAGTPASVSRHVRALMDAETVGYARGLRDAPANARLAALEAHIKRAIADATTSKDYLHALRTIQRELSPDA